MKQNMKFNYQRPQTTVFSLVPGCAVLVNTSFTTEKNGSKFGYSKDSQTDEQFSRENKGYGNGLWEDMK